MQFPGSPFGGVPAIVAVGAFGAAKTLNIADNVAAKAGNYKNLLLAGQGGAADDLDNITGYNAGDMVVIGPASDSITITVKDNANLNLQGADFVMNDLYDSMILLNIGSNKWKELSRSAN